MWYINQCNADDDYQQYFWCIIDVSLMYHWRVSWLQSMTTNSSCDVSLMYHSITGGSLIMVMYHWYITVRQTVSGSSHDLGSFMLQYITWLLSERALMVLHGSKKRRVCFYSISQHPSCYSVHSATRPWERLPPSTPNFPPAPFRSLIVATSPCKTQGTPHVVVSCPEADPEDLPGISKLRGEYHGALLWICILGVSWVVQWFLLLF
jgi:hypothetical protein